VITNDNFKKMILLIYRIQANIPVIIMGDTGCGKTALITKLSQILNNGETKVEIINIHPGITDKKLCDIMKEKDEIAKKQKDEELWLFFDELNTCLSLSLLTEIFINRSYNGNCFSDNIRLIGACNPYRKRKGNKERYGLSMSDDNDNELVYLVEPLPQSLLYYVFSFGSIDDIDEKKYIYSIIEPLFLNDEKYLHEITTEAISECHIYLRKSFDPSVVSLREIARFSKCIGYFKNYFTIKNNYEKITNNEKNNKLRSIICSIYLNYYIRLIDDTIRTNFEANLRPILLKLINNNKKLIIN
jgi:energy-coupling factor transporter ATP-binding protein EcfA2